MEFHRRILQPLDRFFAPRARTKAVSARDGATANASHAGDRDARGANRHNPALFVEGQRILWPAWLRTIERMRRLLSKSKSPRRAPLPVEYYAAITFASFRLDGIEVTEAQIAQALARGPASRGVRTRLTLRIRNHISILRRIEAAVRVGESLKGQTVIRWYTSISCGLSTTALDEGTIRRLDLVVRRINSPQLRLQPAMTELAQLHRQLLADPFVPSFNGILARLLLQYHLGRCGLPPVIFDPDDQTPAIPEEPKLLRRIMEMVECSYSLLLSPM
jgi:hypothetical protein